MNSKNNNRQDGPLQRLVGPALDAAVLKQVEASGRMTYVVANWFRSENPKARLQKTADVRRALFRLEKAGMVERCMANYSVGALKSEVQHLTRGKVLHDSNEEVRAFAA